jgi:pyochelin biosynthetic protein PchC
MTTGNQGPGQWLSVLRRPPRPVRRVVLFPHAGAGPHALNGLVTMVPADAEVLALTLPGREHRFAEAPRATVEQVLTAVESGLRERPALPTLMFGASVGALLAVRAARRLADLAGGVVVAAQSPGAHERWALHARGERQLLRVFTAAGDTPAAVLADPDMRASLLERLSADLRLGAEAERGFPDIRLTVPLTVLGGLEDALVPAAHLPGWARHTTGTCRVVTLSGGHFAFLAPGHRGVVGAVLREAAGALRDHGAGEGARGRPVHQAGQPPRQPGTGRRHVGVQGGGAVRGGHLQ